MPPLRAALRASLAALLVSVGAGCSASLVDETNSGNDAVTGIESTSVKEQVIGTCWLYTTAAWAESLHLAATGKTVDLSETYWTYWTFFERIVGGKVDPNGFIEETGTWGDAAETIARYGLVREADFIPEDLDHASTDRAEDAFNAILFDLSAGELKTPAARRDRALVRKRLDAAFQLRPEVSAWLDATFGADAKKVLGGSSATVPSGSPVVRAADFEVLAGPNRKRPLSALLGVDLPNIDPNRRTGIDAWQYVQYPRGTDAAVKRKTLARVQRALNDKLPVIVSWRVDHAAVKADGTLTTPSSRSASTEAHLSLVTDYQASNVAGFGTLAVGKTETRPEALTAALADSAKVDLLRIKNSWGAKPRQSSAIPPGFYDIAQSYYDATFDRCSDGTCSTVPAMSYVILPPGY